MRECLIDSCRKTNFEETWQDEQTMKLRASKLSLISLFCYFVLLSLLSLYIRDHVRKIIKGLTVKVAHSEKIEKENVAIGSMSTVKTVTKPYKSILIYSTLFGLEYWPTLGLKEIGSFMNRCEVKECSISYDKQLIVSADAVLFHGVDVKNDKRFTAAKLHQVAKNKRVDQKWVFFIQESPDNYNDFSEYSGLFNWLMSYKYTSDIQNPYGHYKALDPWDVVPSDHINYAFGKKRVGIWLVSNCGHLRDDFIKELRRYVPISVGGKCAMNIFNESLVCDQGSSNCMEFIKSHKFIFAFENSFCDYYVSEKYWNKGIDFGLVPVVMGARYDNNNVIPGSYIDASKYNSIEELGRYLNFLHANDSAYNAYFVWKKKYKRIGYEKMCELCKALHENRHKRAYTNIWSSKEDCEPFVWKKDMMRYVTERSKKNAAHKFSHSF